MKPITIKGASLHAVLLLAALTAGTAAAHEKHEHRAPEQPKAAATETAARPPAARRSEWQTFVSHIRRPEYLHMLVVPIPALGMILGILLILGHRFRRDPVLMEAGLAVIAATSLLTAFAVWLGQRAYDRLFETLSSDSQLWLDVHMGRAESFQYAFYAAGALALATLWAKSRRPSAVHPLLLAALLAASLSAVLAGMIAHAGGLVQHPELREGPPTSHP